MRRVVFPGGKPQQYHFHFPFCGLADQDIKVTEIKLPLFRFDLLPRHRNTQGVSMHGINNRPHFIQRSWIVGGIIRLRPQHQKRLTIDEKGMAAVLSDHLR